MSLTVDAKTVSRNTHKQNLLHVCVWNDPANKFLCNSAGTTDVATATQYQIYTHTLAHYYK